MHEASRSIYCPAAQGITYREDVKQRSKKYSEPERYRKISEEAKGAPEPPPMGIGQQAPSSSGLPCITYPSKEKPMLVKTGEQTVITVDADATVGQAIDLLNTHPSAC